MNIKLGKCRAEIERSLILSSGMVKMVMGVVNNAAEIVMVDAFERVKSHKNFRRAAKYHFNLALKARDEYEQKLKHSRVRFFDTSDMHDSCRKIFSERFSNDDYFEYWQGFGALAYSRLKPMVEDLRQAYQRVLERYCVADAEVTSHVMAAYAVLLLSVQAFNETMRSLKVCVSMSTRSYVFSPFSMGKVANCWMHALEEFNRDALLCLDADEDEEIASKIRALHVIVDPSFVFDSIKHTIGDFNEVFRNNGYVLNFHKKLNQAKRAAMEDCAVVPHNTDVEIMTQDTMERDGRGD